MFVLPRRQVTRLDDGHIDKVKMFKMFNLQIQLLLGIETEFAVKVEAVMVEIVMVELVVLVVLLTNVFCHVMICRVCYVFS